MIPCNVWVISGPFIGCQSSQAPGTPQVWLKGFTNPAGLPRSQPIWSMRPSTWQLAQLA
jgi:hypothetical protein